MEVNEFIDELCRTLEPDAQIVKPGFNADRMDFNYKISNFNVNKLMIVISSSFLNDNIYILSKIQNKDFLKAIISLPIYSDDDNLVILTLDSTKNNSDVLLIDESDSLIHKDVTDWSYIKSELIAKISDSYGDFKENSSSVILSFEDIIPEAVENASKRKSNNDLLSLKDNMGESSSTRKHRILSSDIADGLLALKEEKSLRSEFSKRNIKTADTHHNTSFSLFNDAMYYKKRQNPENLLYKNNKPLFDCSVPFRKLIKIADLKNIDTKNDNDSILIATCKSCTTKLVNYNFDVPDFGGEVFIEISNIDESVSQKYLYEFLSSDYGIEEILYYSKGNYYITPQNIKNIRIPIPPLDVQNEIAEVSRESREFFRSVDLLKKEYGSNILDYKSMKDSLNEFKGEIAFDGMTNEVTKMPRSWRHAYNGLIWPLAISYLSATRGGYENVEQKDNYLVLFEFVAAFNAIILLSGLPDDVFRNNFNEIWGPKKHLFKQVTFGSWIYLTKNLSKVYRQNNFTSSLDEELFKVISDDKIINILEKAKDIRNDESHGAQLSSHEAKDIIDTLNVYLEDIFDILDIYSNYKLIYVTGNVDTSQRVLNHQVILLNGPCAQPIYDNIIFDEMLFGDCLYLYNPKNNKKLLIKENLMKFAPIDKNKRRWALFLYYSCDKDEYNASYRCFQSRENDLKNPIQKSFKYDILGDRYG